MTQEHEKLVFNDGEGDEVVVLRLPRNEVKMLREMIHRQQAMSWVWKWITAFGLVVVSGAMTLLQFGDGIRKGLSSWLVG